MNRIEREAQEHGIIKFRMPSDVTAYDAESSGGKRDAGWQGAINSSFI